MKAIPAYIRILSFGQTVYYNCIESCALLLSFVVLKTL
nr:MAG TPA: hypothetical protein [Caudoviricetes sp.]